MTERDILVRERAKVACLDLSKSTSETEIESVREQ